MIQISSLYSLEDVQDYYFITDSLEVVNTITGNPLAINTNKRGYPVVFLQLKKGSSMERKQVFMHKIVALAFIHNGPYILIEHIDDNKLDYRPENLKFSNHSANGKNAFITGKHIRHEQVFNAILANGSEYQGTMKELAKVTGIPRATLYDRFYKGCTTTNPRSRLYSVTVA